MNEHEETIVTLEFKDGYTADCFVVGVFDCDGAEYMALAPDDGSDFVYLYEYKQIDDDNFSLTEVDSDERWKRVAEEFSTIFEDDNIQNMEK